MPSQVEPDIMRLTRLTCTGVGSSQHALHLTDGVLPAASASLHVWLQLVEPVAQVLVALERQLRQLLGHHQLLQVVLQDDHPDDDKERGSLYTIFLYMFCFVAMVTCYL